MRKLLIMLMLLLLWSVQNNAQNTLTIHYHNNAWSQAKMYWGYNNYNNVANLSSVGKDSYGFYFRITWTRGKSYLKACFNNGNQAWDRVTRHINKPSSFPAHVWIKNNNATVYKTNPLLVEEKKLEEKNESEADVVEELKQSKEIEDSKMMEPLREKRSSKRAFAPPSKNAPPQPSTPAPIVIRKPPGKKTKDKIATPAIEKARKLSTSNKYRSRAPELLARIEGPHQSPLPMISEDISVVITAHRARIVLDMVFRNPTSSQISGTLMIQLPDGASPCYLGMFQGEGWKGITRREDSFSFINPTSPSVSTLLGKEIRLSHHWKIGKKEVNWGELRSARVVNPIKGREVYEKITRRRIDPALAEWAGSGKFSTRIFPIPANGYKRVVFAYDRSLIDSKGHLLYALPVPGKIKAQTRLTTHLIGNTIQEAQLLANQKKVPVSKKNYGSMWQILISKKLKGSVIFKGKSINSSLQVLTGIDPQVPGKLVHLRYKPNIKTQNKLQNSRALFILDTSYSSKEKLYNLSGKMLRALLKEDHTIRKFAVICFDVRSRWLTPGFVDNNKQQQQKLLDNVEKIWLEGATNFGSVMEFLENKQLIDKVDNIFLLSDGQITWGVENPKQFASKFAKWMEKRWICYSFGSASVNRTLFQTLTRSRGQIVHSVLGQDLSISAKAHLKGAKSLDYIKGTKREEILVSGNPKMLYPGQVLEIAAIVNPRAKAFTLNIKISGKEHSVQIPLKINPLTSGLAARSWADLYTKRLLELHDESANQVALALSQRFSLTNRQASFIILETDQEYVLHKIDTKKLDFEKMSNLALAHETGRPFGAPRIDTLPKERQELIEALGKLPQLMTWKVKKPVIILDSLEGVLSKPKQKRGGNTPANLYLWARSLFTRKHKLSATHSFRVLSTIVELKPQDDKALRLVGYVLLEWQMYQEALQLFTRVRQRRPFEPQNYLMEGMALTALGQLKEAAVRYEIVLNRSFSRFNSYVKPVAKVLYADLLKTAIKYSHDSLRKKCKQRLESLGKTRTPHGRLLLFWNLDNTDVDLHVNETENVEIYYSNKNSPTGGVLFWDNTTGLGPEFYEHPTLSREGFKAHVKYFGSSSVEGAAPAATLVASFTKDSKTNIYKAHWYATVLLKSKGGKVQIMPIWKR